MAVYTKLIGLLLVAAGAAVAVAGLQDGRLQSLQLEGFSSSTASASLSTTTTTTPSRASASTTTAATTTPTTQAGPARWELSTVFTQPTDCLDGITQYAGALTTLGYWLDIPHPAPGLTMASCFPPALVGSVTAAVDQPPYEQLVCPYQWESYDYNSTYRICCPKDFGFYAPGIISNTDRPGLGAWCTSWVGTGTHAFLTSYFTNGGSSVIDTTLGMTERWMVQATAFDGIVATNVPTAAPTSGSSALLASSPSEALLSRTSTITDPPTTRSSANFASPLSGASSVSQLPSCGPRYLLCGLASVHVLAYLL